MKQWRIWLMNKYHFKNICKFKPGDKIKAIIPRRGFEEATVMDIIEMKGHKCYKLRIPCGKAIMRVTNEDNYELMD